MVIDLVFYLIPEFVITRFHSTCHFAMLVPPKRSSARSYAQIVIVPAMKDSTIWRKRTQTWKLSWLLEDGTLEQRKWHLCWAAKPTEQSSSEQALTFSVRETLMASIWTLSGPGAETLPLRTSTCSPLWSRWSLIIGLPEWTMDKIWESNGNTQYMGQEWNTHTFHTCLTQQICLYTLLMVSVLIPSHCYGNNRRNVIS